MARLSLRLRPVMLGFIVNPGDSVGLVQAIELASTLWGGSFFPVIPLLKRITGPLRHQVPRRITALEMVAGYIEAFDPDVLVKVGNVTIPKELAVNRQIIGADDVLSEFPEDHTPKCGIGAPEFFAKFSEDELTFLRDPPLRILFPKLSSRYRMFLSSVFGILPEPVLTAVRTVVPSSSVYEPSCSLRNFVNFLNRDSFFPRRLMNLQFQRRRRAESCLFLLDASSVQDVIDYWNLRAAGWTVLAIPRQVCAVPEVQAFAKRFIDQNHWEYKHQPGFFHNTNIMKGWKVPPADLARFINGLRLETPKGNNARIVFVPQFPRIWDEWAREKDQVDFERSYASESDIDVSEDVTRLDFKPLAPEFVSRFGGHSTPRFINDVDVRFYGGTDLYAEVIPSGAETLARAISNYGLRDWRFSKYGLSYLCEHPDLKAYFSPPRAELVFGEWLRAAGWKVELSDKGHIAKQMLKHLGGVRGLNMLASPGLIQLLRTMTARPASDNVPGADPDASLEPSGKVLKATTFIPAVQKFASTEKMPQQAVYLRRLLDLQMFRLGVLIQCRTCRQRWWQSLKALDYQVSCPNCFDKFSVASWLPTDFEWAFRTVGPFSLPDSAFGVYSVLLTLRFFSLPFHAATTPLLSAILQKGSIDQECDLSLLFEVMQYGRRNRDVIFSECKTYNELTKKDVERMAVLAEQFPGAVIVFSILRDSLSAREQKLLRPFVNRSRRYWKSDRPVHPVIILTATELFADDAPPRCWESLGGKHAMFKSRYEVGHNLVDLADATQQLYLGLQPWRESLRKTSRKRVAPVPPPLPAEPPPEIDESLVIKTPMHIALRQIESRDWPGP